MDINTRGLDPARIRTLPAVGRPIWEMTRGELLNGGAFFHATSAQIVGELRGGGYDGVFWTAENPAIAQTYIPKAGISAAWDGRSWRHDDSISPEGLDLTLARSMGYECDVTRDERGRVQSYCWRLNGESVWGPKQRELRHHVEIELGYRPWQDEMFRLNLAVDPDVPGQTMILPADYQAPGTLVMASPQAPLRCYDLAAGRDSDLMDPDHLKLDLFRRLSERGFDAVRICDFAQSPQAGNLPHTSIGLFPGALAKMAMHSVPAVHFDSGAHWGVYETPSFVEGHRSLVADAIAHGHQPPPEVLAEYPDLRESRALTTPEQKRPNRRRVRSLR